VNSTELFKDNKKAISTLYQSIFAFVQKAADAKKIGIKALEPKIETRTEPVDITTLGLLRFNAKSPSVYALGYSRPESLKIWRDIFPVVDVSANPALKQPEYEVMKVFFPIVDAEFKAQKITIDPKTALIQDGVTLGGWAKIPSLESLLIPIGTTAGELVLEMPLFDLKYAALTTLDLYGFNQNARIMVVDDSSVSRKASRNFLAMAGYFNVDETADGQQAYSKVVGSTPAYELVVADWHMPVMSGFELLKKLRAIPELKKLPIVLVTGEKNKDEVVNAIREGVTSYLVKPVAPENFMKILKKVSGKG